MIVPSAPTISEVLRTEALAVDEVDLSRDGHAWSASTNPKRSPATHHVGPYACTFIERSDMTGDSKRHPVDRRTTHTELESYLVLAQLSYRAGVRRSSPPALGRLREDTTAATSSPISRRKRSWPGPTAACSRQRHATRIGGDKAAWAAGRSGRRSRALLPTIASILRTTPVSKSPLATIHELA